ncbi:MAG: Crp/Fnr family transcriptional regulator [Alphaproteobacteria bacterium]|nr:Crp/Fnr family transcriptional regulator [Alphaproteobacteria bacterium]
MDNIRDIELFSSLSAPSCQRHASAISWRTYGENELVVDIDDTSDDVLFVVSGMVRVVHRAEVGKEVILGDRGPGSYFGEMAAIDGLARSANVTALQTSRIATLPAATFLDVLAHEPEVCRRVLEGLVGGMRSLTRKLSEHAYLTAVERLYCELLRLSRPRKGHEGQRSISPPPTQQELAERIGSRREVVSRAIGALEKDGLFEKTRGALVLPDPNELNRQVSQKGLWVNLD